ncbi:hypothetical protein B0H16DRAFT_1525884, partial [Mycena metata]
MASRTGTTSAAPMKFLRRGTSLLAQIGPCRRIPTQSIRLVVAAVGGRTNLPRHRSILPTRSLHLSLTFNRSSFTQNLRCHNSEFPRMTSSRLGNGSRVRTTTTRNIGSRNYLAMVLNWAMIINRVSLGTIRRRSLGQYRLLTGSMLKRATGRQRGTRRRRATGPRRHSPLDSTLRCIQASQAPIIGRRTCRMTDLRCPPGHTLVSPLQFPHPRRRMPTRRQTSPPSLGISIDTM